MYYVRTVMPGSDITKPSTTRDVAYETRNEALMAISRLNVLSIKKVTSDKGRIYIVQVKR